MADFESRSIGIFGGSELAPPLMSLAESLPGRNLSLKASGGFDGLME
ncbi:MAG: hypothetical protein GY835_11765 [bacterium]|nr:hypothetical protein [bacterium]